MKLKRKSSGLFLAAALIVVSASPVIWVPPPAIAQSTTGSSPGGSSGGGGLPSGQVVGAVTSVVGSLLGGGGLSLSSLLGTLTGLLGQFGTSLGLSGSTLQIVNSLGSVLGSIVGGGGLNSGSLTGIAGAIGSIANLNPQQQQLAQGIAGILPGVIQSINSGNINGLLNAGLAIYNLLNPQQAQNAISSPPGSPGGGLQLPSTGQTIYPIQDASSPYGVRYATRLTEKYKTDQFYKNSQIVLSEEGLERIISNLETSSSALQQSGAVTERLVEWDDVQVKAAQTSLDGADFSVEVANQGIQAKASQDVLKSILMVNAAGNAQNAMISGQTTYVARSLAGLSTQMAALQGQSRIISEQTSVLEMLSANQLQQQGQMAQYLDQQNAREEANDIAGIMSGQGSMKNIYIPGYVPRNASLGGGQVP